MIGNYRRQLEADFARRYPQHSLGDLWRSRRWRYLLNLIDHLPQDTHYHQAVSNDPEHAKMLVEAKRRSKDSADPWAPPMHAWSAEVDMGAKVLDAVNQVRHVLIAANSEKGKAPKAPDPHPRPRTVMERMEKEAKRERHESLANRILARRQQKPTS